jgi:hypothetical protein
MKQILLLLLLLPLTTHAIIYRSPTRKPTPFPVPVQKCFGDFDIANNNTLTINKIPLRQFTLPGATYPGTLTYTIPTTTKSIFGIDPNTGLNYCSENYESGGDAFIVLIIPPFSVTYVSTRATSPAKFGVPCNHDTILNEFACDGQWNQCDDDGDADQFGRWSSLIISNGGPIYIYRILHVEGYSDSQIGSVVLTFRPQFVSSVRPSGAPTRLYVYKSHSPIKYPTRRPTRTPTRVGWKAPTTRKPTSFPSHSSFNISIYYYSDDGIGKVPMEVQTAFQQAANRWQQIIGTQGFTSKLTLTSGTYICPTGQRDEFTQVECIGAGRLTQPITWNDLLIGVQYQNLDGPNGLLGNGGPCRFTTNIVGGPLKPRAGMVYIDSSDIDWLNVTMDNGFSRLYFVALHEIGHVLGIGTHDLWFSNLNETDPFSPDNQISFRGTNAIDAWQNDIQGELWTGGFEFPVVENEDPQSYAHWKEKRESLDVNNATGGGIDVELMTGFMESSQFMPLSKLTAKALIDLGYININENAADDFIATNTPTVPDEDNSLDDGQHGFRRTLNNRKLSSSKKSFGNDAVKFPHLICPSEDCWEV